MFTTYRDQKWWSIIESLVVGEGWGRSSLIRVEVDADGCCMKSDPVIIIRQVCIVGQHCLYGTTGTCFSGSKRTKV